MKEGGVPIWEGGRGRTYFEAAPKERVALLFFEEGQGKGGGGGREGGG